MKHNLFLVVAIVATVFFLFFIITSTWIGMTVDENCQEAMATYSGDCVTALSLELADESASYRDRNDAIWALGQLGDDRALETLNQYWTGEITRTKYDEGISQYELAKARKLLTSGFNITHIIRW